LTAGGAASTGDGMGQAAASSAASIRGARARVMHVGAQGGGLCVSREKEEGKRRREKRKEEKEKGERERDTAGIAAATAVGRARAPVGRDARDEDE